MRIIIDQVRELLEQDKRGRINCELLLSFLINPLGWTDGGIVELKLKYCEGIVAKLGDKAGPWGYRNENINDDNYPVKGKGVVKIKFRFIPGELLERVNGWVCRSDVETYFRDRGMRFTTAVEAMLPPANDEQLGRDGHPYVAFICESHDAIIVDEDGRGRLLDRKVGPEDWRSNCVFVGVCK